MQANTKRKYWGWPAGQLGSPNTLGSTSSWQRCWKRHLETRTPVACVLLARQLWFSCCGGGGAKLEPGELATVDWCSAGPATGSLVADEERCSHSAWHLAMVLLSFALAPYSAKETISRFSLGHSKESCAPRQIVFRLAFAGRHL